MKNNGQSRLLNNIVSPYGLAMISYVLFLFACLFPPSVYTRYMKEPDLMFLDPATILFYTLCVVSFMSGVWFLSWLFPSSFVDCNLEIRISPLAFLLIPLFLVIATATITNFYLIRSYPIILFSLLTQQGGDIKDTVAFDVDGHLAFVPLLLIGVTWWSFWRYSDVDLRGWRKRLVAAFLVTAVLTVLISSTLTLSRDVLMLGVCGLAVSYIARRTKKKQVNSKFILQSSIGMALCISLLFFAFSFLRGTVNLDEQVHSLIGYTVASYNRLAAIMNGHLHYPLAGRGMYLSSVVAHSRVLLLSKVMGLPSGLDVWGSEFGAVSRAGLSGNLIWSGAFGYIFSELGWFSPFFVFGYGILYGVVWNWIKRGKTLGVVLYPFFGFCTLFWLGTNYLLDQPAEVLLFVALILSGYEYVLVRSTEVRIVAQNSTA